MLSSHIGNTVTTANLSLRRAFDDAIEKMRLKKFRMRRDTMIVNNTNLLLPTSVHLKPDSGCEAFGF